MRIFLIAFLFPFLSIAQTADDYYQKGQQAFTNDNSDLAIEFINKAIELRPNFCNYYVTKAIWEISTKSNEDASPTQLRSSLNDINKAINLGCNEAYVFSLRAGRYKKLGLMQMAKEDYQKALMLLKDTTSFITYYDRATIKVDLEDYYGAIKDYSKVILLDKECESCNLIYGLRGDCKAKLNDYKGALVDYTKQLNLNTSLSLTTGELYCNRGTMKMKLNDMKGACEDWSRAGEIGYMVAFDLIKTNCTSLQNNNSQNKKKKEIPKNNSPIKAKSNQKRPVN